MKIEKLGEAYRAFIKEDMRLAAEEDTETYGHPFTRCTNIAKWLQEHFFPDAQVVGYLVDDPDRNSKKIGAGEGGHDFLIVNHRYILDFWPRTVIDPQYAIAYDLHNQKGLIFQHYYHPDIWTISGRKDQPYLASDNNRILSFPAGLPPRPLQPRAALATTGSSHIL